MLPAFARPLTALVATFFLAGCSLLLNSGVENHPCGTNDACLPGYACNSKGICVTESKAQCATPCTGGTKCVRQQCREICQDVACAPGFTCGETGCVPVTASGSVGFPCADDSECGTNTSLFCMLPYTGGARGLGVCTSLCQHTPADTCPGGSVCKDFTTTNFEVLRLCANPGLTACQKESECTPSGLACGVIANRLSGGAVAASVCVNQIDGGASLGDGCEPGSSPCANGLCIVSKIGSTTTLRVCSTPCSENVDCAGIAGGICEQVTLVQPKEGTDPTPPIVRMPLCVTPPRTVSTICDPSDNQCGPDAPHCVLSSANNVDHICAPNCTDTTAERCPNAALTCDGTLCH